MATDKNNRIIAQLAKAPNAYQMDDLSGYNTEQANAYFNRLKSRIKNSPKSMGFVVYLDADTNAKINLTENMCPEVKCPECPETKCPQKICPACEECATCPNIGSLSNIIFGIFVFLLIVLIAVFWKKCTQALTSSDVDNLTASSISDLGATSE